MHRHVRTVGWLVVYVFLLNFLGAAIPISTMIMVIWTFSPAPDFVFVASTVFAGVLAYSLARRVPPLLAYVASTVMVLLAYTGSLFATGRPSALPASSGAMRRP